MRHRLQHALNFQTSEPSLNQRVPLELLPTNLVHGERKSPRKNRQFQLFNSPEDWNSLGISQHRFVIAQVEKLLPLSQSQILRQMQNLIQSHEDFSNPYWPKAQDLHELCVIIVLLNGNMVQKKVQKYIRSLRIAFSHANLLHNVELYADIQTKGVNELYHHLLAMLYVITDHGKPLPTYKLSHYPILEPQEHKLLLPQASFQP